MKFIYCLLLGSFITVTLHSQNCKTLDSKLFFRSIQFGYQIPIDLFHCSNKKNQNQYDTDLRIEYDSLNQDCKDRYSDLFTFLSMPFSFFQARTNRKGQIFLVDLYSFFDDNNHNELMTYDPPANFNDTYNQLTSLYGKPTRTEGATGTDSLFIKELGMPKLVVWECNNIFLQLRVRYGSRQKALNVINIQITNRQFDVPEQVKLEQ